MSEETVDYILNAVSMVARYGWRLMHLYRFNAKTGEWKHHSRMTKFLDRIWSTRIAMTHVSSSSSSTSSGLREGGGVEGVSSADMHEWMATTTTEIETLLMAPQKPSSTTISNEVIPGNEKLHWCLFPSQIATYGSRKPDSQFSQILLEVSSW